MADMDPEVKGSGPSKAGWIAIATALIGAGTTISVAYINRTTPAAEVKPAPPSPQPAPETQPASIVDANDETDIPPQPLMQTTLNVAGLWTAANGEEMEITQTGTQLVVSGGAMADFGPIVWQGYGRIADRKVSWIAKASANGNQIEMECKGRLTNSSNSIEGMCEAMGQQQPFQYHFTR